jgi:sugar phosphate permease
VPEAVAAVDDRDRDGRYAVRHGRGEVARQVEVGTHQLGDPAAGAVGKRVQVVMAYMVGVAVALAAFWATPASAGALQWLCVFAVGFFLYGPQMLIGLCGAELVGPDSVGASEGFLGWVAYLGAANAGVPLALVVQNHGWSAYFATLLAACGGALLLLAPMVRLRSHVQRVEAGEA